MKNKREKVDPNQTELVFPKDHIPGAIEYTKMQDYHGAWYWIPNILVNSFIYTIEEDRARRMENMDINYSDYASFDKFKSIEGREPSFFSNPKASYTVTVKPEAPSSPFYTGGGNVNYTSAPVFSSSGTDSSHVETPTMHLRVNLNTPEHKKLQQKFIYNDGEELWRDVDTFIDPSKEDEQAKDAITEAVAYEKALRKAEDEFHLDLISPDYFGKEDILIYVMEAFDNTWYCVPVEDVSIFIAYNFSILNDINSPSLGSPEGFVEFESTFGVYEITAKGVLPIFLRSKSVITLKTISWEATSTDIAEEVFKK
jgi:hypothetical protein